MNLFFLILAIIVFMFFLKTVVNYKNRTKLETVFLIISGIFNIFLFLCAFFMVD